MAPYRPTTRVLTALELLQTHGRVGGADLAERLGVDRRTVRRYIVQLEELGVPITAERGRHGAYALVPGFKLPPMMFTDDEALAVSVGLLAARELGLADAAPAVASAQAKLERVMPATLKRRVRAVDETVSLDLTRGEPARDNAALVTLSEAARTRTRAFVRYRSAAGSETERAIDPYGLAYRHGCWYAVGHCHLRNALRSFRLDRILGARVGTEVFERPEGFDALGYLSFSIASLPRAFAVEILIEASLVAARRAVPQTLGVLVPVGEHVLLSAQVDDLDWCARELARLPFSFRIRRPRELAGVLEGHARRLLVALKRPAGPRRRAGAARGRCS